MFPAHPYNAKCDCDWCRDFHDVPMRTDITLIYTYYAGNLNKVVSKFDEPNTTGV